MKNRDLFKILEKKDSLLSLSGFKFVKTVYHNLKLITDEVTILQKYVEPSNEVKEFLDKKKLLLEKYATKDENGVAIKKTTEDGISKYDIPEDSEYHNEVVALIETYKEYLESAESMNHKYIEAMNSDCDIKFKMINEKDVPENITLEQLEVIADWIDLT